MGMDKLARGGLLIPSTPGFIPNQGETIVPHKIRIEGIEDIVRVVRCKDCKHYKRICEDSNKFMCMITHGLIAAKADDFCSSGERREGEGL